MITSWKERFPMCLGDCAAYDHCPCFLVYPNYCVTNFNFSSRNLECNKFTGSIPRSLAECRALYTLFVFVYWVLQQELICLWDRDVHANKLSGAVPSWLNSLYNLSHLYGFPNNCLTFDLLTFSMQQLERKYVCRTHSCLLCWFQKFEILVCFPLPQIPPIFYQNDQNTFLFFDFWNTICE